MGQGSTVSFSFKGSSVSIVGSKGANHGKFIISIDQDQSKQQIIDGFSSNSIYQTPLYAIDGLSGDKHTIKVTNFVEDSSRSVLDVDYIEFVTGQDDNVYVFCSSFAFIAEFGTGLMLILSLMTTIRQYHIVHKMLGRGRVLVHLNLTMVLFSKIYHT